MIFYIYFNEKNLLSLSMLSLNVTHTRWCDNIWLSNWVCVLWHDNLTYYLVITQPTKNVVVKIKIKIHIYLFQPLTVLIFLFIINFTQHLHLLLHISFHFYQHHQNHYCYRPITCPIWNKTNYHSSYISHHVCNLMYTFDHN